MNPDVPVGDAVWRYYDSDYPPTEMAANDPELASVMEQQGVLFDTAFYACLAELSEGPVLDIGCGSGRVTLPIARAGLRVTGVDVAPAMLARLRGHLALEEVEVARRVKPVLCDIRHVDLPRESYALAVWSFNGLLLLHERKRQIEGLRRVSALLRPGARLALDIVNPLTQPLTGVQHPLWCFTRINPANGNPYSRFVLVDPMDAEQCQRIHGWYDEIDLEGQTNRSPFAFRWRLIFAGELESMLELAGFRLDRIEGGFRGEPFTSSSPTMVATATRI